jgi:hypothetical protein
MRSRAFPQQVHPAPWVRVELSPDTASFMARWSMGQLGGGVHLLASLWIGAIAGGKQTRNAEGACGSNIRESIIM